VQLKKEAYHRKVRSQQLRGYFQQQREQLCRERAEHPQMQERVEALLQRLPDSASELLDLLNEEYAAAGPFLIVRMRELCHCMVGLPLPQWSHMVFILSKLLVSTGDPTAIETVVNHSLMPVLEGALLLAGKTEEQFMRGQLLSLALEYCFRLGGYVRRLHQLEENALVEVLRLLWREEWKSEGESMLLLTVYHILGARFEEEDEENVTPQQQGDLERMKVSLIARLFYSGDKRELGRLVERTCGLCGQQFGEDPSACELLEQHLRVLIMLTLYLSSPSYYFPLLGGHLLVGLQMVFMLHREEEMLLILAVRLLNNLLVNEFKLTLAILKEFPLSLLAHLAQELQHREELQVEIAELFMNLLHFMNDDGELVRLAVEWGIGETLLACFELDEQTLREDTLLYAVNTLLIMDGHCPRDIRLLVLVNQQTLSRAVEKYPNHSEAIESLLASTLQHEEIADL
jgi:hypothetical protein